MNEFALRPYQRVSIDKLYEYFMSNVGNPLIVIPTAGGKSVVIAMFVIEVLRQWPDQRILNVTHVKELIEQNFKELIGLWPEAPAGIYSAGLGLRNIHAQILFCGIQSIYDKAFQAQRVDLLLVDEAHLIPRKSATMYRRFIDDLLLVNPSMKVIGYTATPYRMDSGMLHKGQDRIFTDIAYEVSVRHLVEQGYLCPLVSKPAQTQIDTSNVSIRGGEYVQRELERAADVEAITQAAVQEIVDHGQDRRCWLLFASGVAHAGHICDEVRSRGISCDVICDRTKPRERDRIINDLRSGRLRACASMGVLTTGTNIQPVDLIALLRSTKSTGLFVQAAGRGMRLFPGKRDCLVLDFGGNIAEHGPIDAISPRGEKLSDGTGEIPIKVCPACEGNCLLADRFCPHCGHEFPEPRPKLQQTASTLPVMTNGEPEWLNVSSVSYALHMKPRMPPSMRVDYWCGFVRHREWKCFEHAGQARVAAAVWWYQRTGTGAPRTVAEALRLAGTLPKPTRIAVRQVGKYSEIVDYAWR